MTPRRPRLAGRFVGHLPASERRRGELLVLFGFVCGGFLVALALVALGLGTWQLTPLLGTGGLMLLGKRLEILSLSAALEASKVDEAAFGLVAEDIGRVTVLVNEDLGRMRGVAGTFADELASCRQRTCRSVVRPDAGLCGPGRTGHRARLPERGRDGDRQAGPGITAAACHDVL